jgi:uncharacterized protein involved in outer membrane biogenesis
MNGNQKPKEIKLQKVKIWRNRLFIFIGAILTFYAAINVFLLLGGKNIIANRINTLSGKKIAIGLCFIRPPMVIVARNIKIESLMKADDISCSLSFFSLFYWKPVLSWIVLSKPEIYYEIKPQPDKTVSKDKAVNGEIVSDPTVTGQEKSIQVVLRAIKIKQGRFDIVDYRSADIPIKISGQDVHINLDRSGIKLNARLPWNNAPQEGKIEAMGSFTPAKKEAMAKLNINNIDGAALYPYYSRWINLKEAGIQSARLDFTSNINVVGNNLEAACTLGLSDIVYESKAQAFIGYNRAFNFNLASRFTVINLMLGNIDFILLDNLL